MDPTSLSGCALRDRRWGGTIVGKCMCSYTSKASGLGHWPLLLDFRLGLHVSSRKYRIVTVTAAEVCGIDKLCRNLDGCTVRERLLRERTGPEGFFRVCSVFALGNTGFQRALAG